MSAIMDKADMVNEMLQSAGAKRMGKKPVKKAVKKKRGKKVVAKKVMKKMSKSAMEY